MITFLLIALRSPFLFIRGLGTYIYEHGSVAIVLELLLNCI